MVTRSSRKNLPFATGLNSGDMKCVRIDLQPRRASVDKLKYQHHVERDLMRRLIGSIVLLLAFSPMSHAQDSVGDKAKEVKDGAVKTTDTVADGAREVGKEVKEASHKARR